MSLPSPRKQMFATHRRKHIVASVDDESAVVIAQPRAAGPRSKSLSDKHVDEDDLRHGPLQSLQPYRAGQVAPGSKHPADRGAAARAGSLRSKTTTKACTSYHSNNSAAVDTGDQDQIHAAKLAWQFAEMLKVKAGGKYEIIPYKSGSEGMVAVISNQVDATSEASVVVIPQIQGGKLKAVASTWNKRISALPNVPTTKEQGFPEVFIGHWAGVFAPKGTPEPILEKMNKAIDAALKTPEVQNRLTPQGIEPTPGNRAAFIKFLTDERNRLEPIVKRANMSED